MPPDWQQSPHYHALNWQSIQDGDTITLTDGRRVRFIGIDTPELARRERPAEPLAEGATAALAKRLNQDQERRLVLRIGVDGKDHYGRTLAHVFTAQGENLTAYLLREGWGFQVIIPPNLWAKDCYHLAEQQARNARQGVWGHPYFLPRRADGTELAGGHGLYVGQIERVTARNDWVWVDLVGDISLRFHIKHAEHLRNADFQRLLTFSRDNNTAKHWSLEARGWLVDRSTWGDQMRTQIAEGTRNRWQLDVRHQLQWRLIPPA